MIDKPSLSTEDYEICNKLKSMRFSGMAEALEEVLADPNAELLPFREKIQRIVDAEWNLRYTKKLNRFIKKATLKYPAADLDDTIYHPERQLDAHIIEELSNVNGSTKAKILSSQERPAPVRAILLMCYVSVPCASSKQPDI